VSPRCFARLFIVKLVKALGSCWERILDLSRYMNGFCHALSQLFESIDALRAIADGHLFQSPTLVEFVASWVKIFLTSLQISWNSVMLFIWVSHRTAGFLAVTAQVLFFSVRCKSVFNRLHEITSCIDTHFRTQIDLQSGGNQGWWSSLMARK